MSMSRGDARPSHKGTVMWGGRFAGGLDPDFARFQSSLGVDARLLPVDVRGSVAWAKALGAAGVLTPAEVKRLARGLAAVEAETAREPGLVAGSDAEDVHGFVEARLAQHVGPLAKKLHTGRSRNDQVATDLKLWLREAGARLEDALAELAAALVAIAERHAGAPVPGYTHLQRAQPVTIGHHALAYVEMLARDRGRLRDALARADTCPLGAGALAGTAFPVDRRALAGELGFGGPTRNSLDTVADRDHACEAAFACALILVHLSRLAEDWIFFASFEAGFAELPDATSTGSSLMPQKKNPDALELVRGKAGRVAGDLQALLMTLKGLPLAYDRDLQEDKEALFDAVDTAEACLRVLATTARGITFDTERCAAAAARGYLDATDLADLLVARGVAFRDAHERTGRTVRRALELGVELRDLPAGDARDLLGIGDIDLPRELAVDRVLGRRRAIGGTAPVRVRAEARAWKRRLSSWRT